MERLEDRLTPSAVVVGASPGSLPTVKVLDESGAVVRSFLAYPSTFRRGVTVAHGDLTGDKFDDIVTAPASGPGAVRIFDGASLALIGRFAPYGRQYRGGINLAVGQLVDGSADIVTGTASGRPVVKVFDGITLQETRRILPYGPGVDGVNVAVATLDGGSRPDVVTAPARGGQPVVKVFDAATGQAITSFLAYDASYRGGVQVATGDFNGNRVPDLVTAPNGPGQPLVRIWASGTGDPMIGQFVAAAGSSRLAGSIELGAVSTAGSEPDRIAILPPLGRGSNPSGAVRSVSLYDSSGMGVGSIDAGLGGRAPNLSSAAPEIFRGYTGSKLYATAYSPTWPNWSSNTAAQLNDSDFYTSAFQGLWDIDPTTNQGRQDLANIQAAGFNLVRLYDWGPSRGWNGTSGNAHLPFLDKAQSLGLKVIVPVSDYFLGNDQYSWNGQNPDANFSFASAPQAIQNDLMQFISSVTKNGALHSAVQSISIGNEMDLGIDNDPGSTAKLQRALWWVVNLHDKLATQFGVSVPTPFLTIPISNADQGNGGSNKSWFSIFDHGVSAGDTMPIGAVPGGTFTSSVQGLSSYNWYTTWFYNSVNMFQSGAQLTTTLQQYDTGIASGPTWSQQWPGEKLPVPLLVTELGTSRFNSTQDAQFNAVVNNQAQVATNVLKTSTNLMGYTIFEYNDEPNKNNETGPPFADAFFGVTTYNTSPDQSQFRNGTLLYSLHTGVTPWIGGTLPDFVYPVYQLFPVQSSDGTTLLSKLKSIFAQLL